MLPRLHIHTGSHKFIQLTCIFSRWETHSEYWREECRVSERDTHITEKHVAPLSSKKRLIRISFNWDADIIFMISRNETKKKLSGGGDNSKTESKKRWMRLE